MSNFFLLIFSHFKRSTLIFGQRLLLQLMAIPNPLPIFAIDTKKIRNFLNFKVTVISNFRLQKRILKLSLTGTINQLFSRKCASSDYLISQ